jgi:uncharacterized protein DUF4262
MLTALDVDPAKLDQHEQKFVAQIREHGWFGTAVFGDEEGPGFSYTTGFWLKLNFPEIITFALKRETAHDTFWHIYRTLEQGERFAIGVPIDSIFENSHAALLPVSKRYYKDHLGWSRWFYCGDDFDCVQLIWTDRDGRFPWQHGYATEFVEAQPDLTDNAWSGLREH